MTDSSSCPDCGAKLPEASTGSGPVECPVCRMHDEQDRVETALDGGVEPTIAAAASDGTTPKRIGPYKLRQKVGEGGMGEVWLAEQTEPMRRKVALKLIKLGMDTKNVVARFESERQALAMMDHPCIARVYDAGASQEGRPYFAMEYVKGVSITEYCNTQRLGVRERLELFMAVCEGVQHAHQKGIIHRDIKPSNVLVALQDDKPVPKIIDFGIAKATEPQLTGQSMFTEIGQFVGTPDYMSPEQAEMTGLDIDTRTDVYALGALLYELLVGQRPFSFGEMGPTSIDEIRRKIREDEPSRPSDRMTTLGGDEGRKTATERRSGPAALHRGLQGDLDWITMKALEKDRTRRYASPGEFAADIRRHLEDQPVLASPPSTAYRVKKFVRRNRGAVFAASLILAALVLGIVGTTFGLIRATRAELHANREAVAASTVATFLVGMFEATNPFYGLSRGSEEELTALEVLDSSVERLDGELAEQPAVRAQLQAALGSVYVDLGVYDQSEPLLRDALEYYRANPENHRDELAEVLVSLASLLNMVNRAEEAEPFARESVALYRKLGDDPEALANSLQVLAHPLYVRGDYDEAEPVYREALTLRRQVLGSDHVDTAYTLMNIGYTLFLTGQVEEGAECNEEAIDILRGYENGMHPWLATALNNAAAIYGVMGQEEQKLAARREAADVAQRTLGPDHPETHTYKYNLGVALLERGQAEEGEQMLRVALEYRLETFGSESTYLLGPMLGLARAHQAKGDFEVAEQAFAEAIALAVKLVGTEHISVGFCRQRHASMLHESKRLDEAEQEFLEAIAIFDGVVGPEHVLAIDARRDLGHVLVDLERLEEAEALVQAAVDYYSLEFPVGNWQSIYAECILAGIESGRGRYAEAEGVLLDGLALIESKRGHGSGEWRLIELRLVTLYQAWGKPEKAKQHLPAY